MTSTESGEGTPPAPPTRAQRRDAPSPPTRAQRTGAAEPGGGAAPTRAQRTGSSPATGPRQDGAATPGGADERPDFPDGLRGRFEPVELIDHGSEGHVWRVRPASPDGDGGDGGDGGELAVKVYWVGQVVDRELLGHLDDPEFARHVPVIHGYGLLHTPYGMQAWIAMELLDRGLDRLLAEEAAADGRVSPELALGVVRELAELIDFWHTRVCRNPLDFKPANILVRRNAGEAGADQLVIADFGGLHRFSASQEHGGASKFNLAYAPPEHAWNQHDGPWAWWGLGEIAYELATGRARFREHDGRIKSDDVTVRTKFLGTLDAIGDPRWRLLVRGLLTVAPEHRWGAEQVRAWLRGESPDAHDDRPAAAPLAPITFDHVTYHDPADLAAAMTDNWQRAGAWLADGGADRLASWAERIPGQPFDAERYLLVNMRRNPERAQVAVAAFRAAVVPGAEPVYRGREVDADTLVEFARDPAVLHGMFQAEALGVLAAHPGCPVEVRALLRRVEEEVPRLVDAVAARVTELRGPVLARYREHDGPVPGWRDLDEHERDAAHAYAVLLVLRPEQRRPLLLADGSSPRLRWLLGPWWWRRMVVAGLRGDDGPATVSAAVAALALEPRARGERAHATPAEARYGRTWLARLVAVVWALLALCGAVWVADGFGEVAAWRQLSALPVLAVAAVALGWVRWQRPDQAAALLTAGAWALGLGVWSGLWPRPSSGAAGEERLTDAAPPWWGPPEWLADFFTLVNEAFAVTLGSFGVFGPVSAVLLSVLGVKAFRRTMRRVNGQRHAGLLDVPPTGQLWWRRLAVAPLIALSLWLWLALVGVVRGVYDAGSVRSAEWPLALLPAPALLAAVAAAAVLLALLRQNRQFAWAAAVLAAMASTAFYDLAGESHRIYGGSLVTGWGGLLVGFTAAVVTGVYAAKRLDAAGPKGDLMMRGGSAT